MVGASTTILLVVAISVVLVQSAPRKKVLDNCYDSDGESYPFYSSRTTYESQHGKFTKLRKFCKPIKVWGIIRHGTKYPDKKSLPKIRKLPGLRDQILKNHQDGNGELCPLELTELENWEMDPQFNEKMGEILAPQGKTELRMLGERLRKAFPGLMDGADADDFVFRATKTQRAEESMNSFIKGFLGEDSNEAKIIKAPKNDTLLRPFDSCPRWLKSKKANSTYAERTKFTKGPEVQELLRSVSKRLGFEEKLDIEAILAFYDGCRFERAIYVKRPSVWCSLFSKEELSILEYREDLGIYYYVGPGNKMNAVMGCPLLSDMFEYFENTDMSIEGEPKGVFYFGHTKNLQSFMAAINIGTEDRPLKASKYAMSGGRSYRTSINGPFATNVIAILYKCGKKKKVTFHLAERLTPVPTCKKNGVCELKLLKEEFKEQIDTCSLKTCF